MEQTVYDVYFYYSVDLIFNWFTLNFRRMRSKNFPLLKILNESIAK